MGIEIEIMPDKTKPKNCNILKVRDDHQPVYFEEGSSTGKFKLCDAIEAQWSSEDFSFKELRARIEPWLTSLFQSEHLSLLAGSGLTHAVHFLAAGKSAASMDAIPLTIHTDKIVAAAGQSAQEAGREEGTWRINCVLPTSFYVGWKFCEMIRQKLCVQSLKRECKDLQNPS